MRRYRHDRHSYKPATSSEYIPKENEMRQMAEMMKQVGLVENADISGLIDDSFALAVKVEEVSDIESILNFSN